MELFQSFAQCYRVVAYSRRRNWPNAWPEDDSGCETPIQVADLAALIDVLELGPAHLMGYSYGAIIALLLAAERPDLVRSLILGEAPLLRWLAAMPDGQPVVADFAASVVDPFRDAFTRDQVESGVRVFIDGVIGDGAFDQIPALIQAAIMDNAAEWRLHAEAGEADWPPFFCENARNVHVPTLLLSGELSPPLFQLSTDELARCLPMVERLTIPDVSHDLWNPSLTTEAVFGFLARH